MKDTNNNSKHITTNFIDILHITPHSNGYDKVKLIANKFNKTCELAIIIDQDSLLMTGGFIIKDTKQIRKILDIMTGEEQLQFMKDIREEPFIKEYYEE